MRLPARLCRGSFAGLFVLLIAPVLFGQSAGVQPRITQAVDATKLATLAGNTHPLARAEYDRGPAPATLRLDRMLLLLRRDPGQESQLEQLLDQQQEKSSANFRKWLTPTEFGEQFGPAEQDVQTVVSWLTSQGFQVSGVSNGRTVVEFSGTAGQVQRVFHTAIHAYQVNGQQHWANATDPQIPSALAPVVAGFDSLNNFARRPLSHSAGAFHKDNTTGIVTPLNPQFTYPTGCSTTSNPFCLFPLGPYDFAAIYNVLPLWNAATPIDGTGETIAVVGETDINPQDFADFRSLFGISGAAGTLNIIQNGSDPGTNGAEPEADIDTQWAGAVAKGATIDYVVSASTEATPGIDLSAEYIVDNNLAPILSESYGQCELFLGSGGNQFYSNLWQQAAAEGITVVLASGDQGSATCDDDGTQYAQKGLAVSGVASTPYDVAVGGTDFNDLTNPATYWNLTNDVNHASAKGYIPEMTWNNSCTNAEVWTFFQSSTAEQACNNAQAQNDGLLTVTAGGGGTSACTTPGSTDPASCAGGYAQPAWQTSSNNANAPNDGKRHIPDVSFFASNGFNGSFYVICQRDAGTTCGLNDLGFDFQGYGGTSVTAPAFAGVMALIDQETGSRQGNANYVLYSWAAESGTSCNSNAPSGNSCVFYDISNGTIAMPCLKGSPSCQLTNASDQYGVLSGYSSGAGYDLASGLGSVNVANLVNGWSNVAGKFQPSITTLTLNNGTAVSVPHGSTVPVAISVAAASSGSPAPPVPTGDVSLIAAAGNSPASVGTFTLNNGSISGTTNMLPGGTSYSVKAHYAGDANYAASDSTPVTVTVTPENSETSLRVVTSDLTGNITSQNASSFSYGSPYLLRADVTNSSAASCFNTGTNTMSYACPTGSISFTDGGKALGTASSALNSQGYTENFAIQLTGGTHALGGNYAGDNSYTSSSGSDTVTVTPAATTTSITYPPTANPPQTVIIGQPFSVGVSTKTGSSGAAPTGTYTVMDGGTAIGSGPVIGDAASNTSTAFSNGSAPGTAAAPAGPHTISVVYSGDTNYAPSTSAPVTVNALYGTTLQGTATPDPVIYGYGTSVTISVTVSTKNPASNPALEPTGTVGFTANEGSTVTASPAQNSSGNWILQASLSFIPTEGGTVFATYSGDSNYAPSMSVIDVVVVAPDFSISAGSTPLTITAGQSGTATLTVTPLTNYTSTVALSCSPYSAPIPGSTCSISPSSVTLANGTVATATLTLSIAAPSSNLSAAVPRRNRAILVWMSRNDWWTLSATAGLVALLVLLLPGRRERRRAALGFGLTAVLALSIGCGGGAKFTGNGGGGGGGSGGSGGGPTPPAATTTTLSTTAAKIALGSAATLTAAVHSSNGITGTVSFLDASFPGSIGPYVNVVNGSAQTPMVASGSVFPGTHGISAKYSGDANNQGSQSGVVNVTVTGNTTQAIFGQTGPQPHFASLNVVIQ